jgi:hypothetical protein
MTNILLARWSQAYRQRFDDYNSGVREWWHATYWAWSWASSFVLSTVATEEPIYNQMLVNDSGDAILSRWTANAYYMWNYDTWFVARFKIADMSDATHNAIHFLWITQSQTTDAFWTDCVWITYDRSRSTTNFMFITRKDGVETTTDTWITVDTNRHTFKMRYDKQHNKMKYQIDSNTIIEIDTNVPNDVAMHYRAWIYKSAWNNTDKRLFVDYINFVSEIDIDHFALFDF